MSHFGKQQRRKTVRLVSLTLFVVQAHFSLHAQVVKFTPDPKLPPPPVTYRGLVPGISSNAAVRKSLGDPQYESSWYSYKLIYPAQGRPDHFDAIHLTSSDVSGTVGTIEAASVPVALDTWSKVHAKLGEPEFFLELSRASIADYSAKGVRFVFDLARRTIGVAYIPHGRTRVHSGARKFLSLRHLRQGPQKKPVRPADPGGLRAGAAEVDLTPQNIEWLDPKVRQSGLTVHDPLKARCAVLERDGLTIAVVGADLFGMLKEDVDAIEAMVRAHGIDHLLFAMSHNHSALDTIGVYGFYPTRYIQYIQDQVKKGVLTAKERLQPVSRWVAASDELPLDGARVQGLIRNARNPGLLHPQLAVVQAVGTGDAPIVTFVHLACHVEGLATNETSADFPGYLCDTLKAEIGGDIVFLNGALGGMVTGDTIARSHEQAAVAGRRLAQEAKRLLAVAVPPREMALRFERYRLEIPVTNVQLLERVGRRRKSLRGRLSTEMFYLELGDAQVVTVPGELLPEIAFEILERMRGYPRLIVGLANDEIGYLIPGHDFNAGQYEETMSIGPAAGTMVRAQALRILEKANDPPRFERTQ